MSVKKICVWCLREYESRNSPGSQDYAKQKFCQMACSIKFRKLTRHKKPLPPEVAAEAARQGVLAENAYDTIKFRNLDPTHHFNEIFMRKDNR